MIRKPNRVVTHVTRLANQQERAVPGQGSWPVPVLIPFREVIPLKSEEPKPISPVPDNIWLELFEAAFQEDGALAERAARLWHYLLCQIESGPEGITCARQSLENAIRIAFPFTETFRSCRNLFEASLSETFKPSD